MHPRATVGRTTRRFGVVTLLVWAAAARGGEPEHLREATRQAIEICHAADRVPVAEREALLAIGIKRAEEAVKTDPDDAAAHFAVFCNIGKGLMHRSGWRLLSVLGDLGRARKEIDLALALAPDFPGALAAKGELLTELPGFLGGDRQEGERLLRRAVDLEPDDPRMRLMLANVLQTAGQRDEARAHAAIAVGILERAGTANDLATARTLVASLQ
ncbi:MAG: tetratricopeptide repeat protein [bacterium]